VIVATGKVDGQNSMTAHFGFPVTSRMAPNARIVVYYARADGEIVTDSISFDVDGAFQNQVQTHQMRIKTYIYLFVMCSIRWFTHSLISLIYSFHSFVGLFICSFVHSFISFIPFIRSFARLFVRSLMYSFFRLFINLCMY
jgi:hypothetical protein